MTPLLDSLISSAKRMKDSTILETLNNKKFKGHLSDYRNFHPVYRAIVVEAINRGLVTV